MLMFFEPQAAVTAALEIVTRVGQETSLAACAGVHWGRVIYRAGDDDGAAVNLAARLAGAAGRHQVLIIRGHARGKRATSRLLSSCRSGHGC